jgi:hypothetical protein
MKLLRYSLAAALLVAATTTSAKADVSGLTNTIVPGILNTYIDSSNENVQEANGTVGLQVGDTIIGIAQINQNQTPGNPGLNKNTIYAVLSVTVDSFNSTGTQINFRATNSGPRSLQSILSGIVPAADLPAGTMAAVFDVKSGTFPNDLIGQAPPASFTGINDYIKNVGTNGVFDFSVGTTGAAGSNDFFRTNLGTDPLTNNQIVANTSFVVPGTEPATTATLGTLPNGLQFAQNFGGLSVLANATTFVFATDNNIGQDGNTHQLVITASTENGAVGAVGAAVFGSGGPNNAGTTDKNTFLFVPNVAPVPEPSSIVLLGCGVAGFFGVGLRRKKKAVVAE